MRSWPVVPLVPLLVTAVTATPASAAPSTSDAAGLRPVMTTIATGMAARTDRRPVAGGLYDAHAATTFVSWAGQFEDNYVQALDHRTGVWSAPVRIGDGDNDSHNYPTMVQADDGHLLVFRSMHNTELRVARSAQPHSIAGEWTDTVIPEGFGATYPMPFKADDGAIFVFIRETARDFDRAFPTDTRPMKYVRSTDNGRTWSSSQALTGDRWSIAPLDRADNMNEIYIGQLRHEPARPGRPERVGIVYTLAGGGPEGHLHDRYHRNVYYVSFSPRDLRFRSAAGHDLGTSIDDAEQEAHLRIVETPLQTVSPRSPDYISLVGSTTGHAPFVLWMQYDTSGVLHDHAAVWTPRGWQTREVATGVRVRSMEPLGPLAWRVYTTVDGGTGIGTALLVAGRWWHAESTIATAKPIQRVEVIDGYRDPARLLVTGASSDRDVSIADGDVAVLGLSCTS